jgi:hypothetical protein
MLVLPGPGGRRAVPNAHLSNAYARGLRLVVELDDLRAAQLIAVGA